MRSPRCTTRFTGLLAASSWLCGLGCAVNQEREVSAYREVLDRGLAGQTADDNERTPLSLNDAMLLANAYSESLAIQGEDYLQAIIQRRRAVAAFLPTIALSPSYAVRDEPFRASNGDGGEDAGGSRSTLDVPLDASMSVNPVRDVANVNAADADIVAARATLRDAQDALLIDVARAFYLVLRAERAVTVLENSLTVQEERVRDARGRQEAGVVRPLDVSLSESQAADTRVLLTEARTSVTNSRTLLAFLTARQVQERPLEDTFAPSPTIDSPDTLIAFAEMNRQDIQAADAAVVAAGHRVESAYGQYFPTISLDVSWFLSRESSPSDLDWTALLNVSAPLFSAGLIEADVRDALSQLRQTKLALSLTRRQASTDVQLAHASLLAAAQRTADLAISVQAASDALEQSEGLYRVGLATNLERLAAQDRLLNAQLELANAEFDQKVFHLDLLRTTGLLHEFLGIQREAFAAQSSASGARH